MKITWSSFGVAKDHECCYRASVRGPRRTHQYCQFSQASLTFALWQCVCVRLCGCARVCVLILLGRRVPPDNCLLKSFLTHTHWTLVRFSPSARVVVVDVGNFSHCFALLLRSKHVRSELTKLKLEAEAGEKEHIPDSSLSLPLSPQISHVCYFDIFCDYWLDKRYRHRWRERQRQRDRDWYCLRERQKANHVKSSSTSKNVLVLDGT